MKQRLKGLICGWLVLVMLVGMLATPAMASPSNSIYLYTGTSPLKAGDSFSKWERPTVSEDTQLSSLITNTPDGATLTGWNLWKFGTDTISSGFVLSEILTTGDADWKLSSDDIAQYAGGTYFAFEPLYAYSANIDVYIGEDALYWSNFIYSDDMEERQIALNSALSKQDVLSDLATNNLIGWNFWAVDSGRVSYPEFIEPDGVISADNIYVDNPSLLEAMYAAALVSTDSNALEPQKSFDYTGPVDLELGTPIDEQSDITGALNRPSEYSLDGWKLWNYGASGWVYETDGGSPKTVSVDHSVTYDEFSAVQDMIGDYRYIVIEPIWALKYKIDPQPTSDAPTVGAKETTDSGVTWNDTAAEYQWYNFKIDTYSVVKTAAAESELGAYYTRRADYQDGKWETEWASETSKTAYVGFEALKGDVITVKFDTVFSGEVVETSSETGYTYNPGTDTYTYTVTEDGNVLAYLKPDDTTAESEASFTITVTRPVVGVAVSGQNTNTLSSGIDGNQYVCKVTFGNGDVLTSDAVTYTAPPTYTVTFDANGGSNVEEQTIETGNKIIEPTEPARTGYTFGGWYKETSCINAWDFENDTVSEPITLYAKWTAYEITQQPTVDNEYEVKVNPSDGVAYTWHEMTETDVTMDNAEVYTYNDLPSSYNEGWWTAHSTTGMDGTPAYFYINLDAGDIVDITLSRSCTARVNIYYNNQAGQKYEDWKEIDGVSNLTLTAPGSARYYMTVNVRDSGEQPTVKAKVIKAGEAIDGQTTSKLTDGVDGTNYVTKITYPDGAVLTSDAVCYISPSFDVTFDTDGGTAVSKQTVDNGSTVDEPTSPTKTGYTFAGWYKDSGLATAWDFDTDTVTEPVTLYAKWTASTDTPYVVNHWVQTLDAAINGNAEKNETNYELKETKNLTGTTDSTFKAATMEIEGFTAPDKETITIAADGSTVHNYYYTRNKYNIVINTDEGVEELSGNGQYYYEQAVDIFATLKSGYKWNEWLANETEYGSANISYSFNMPAKALVLSPKTTPKAEVIINTDVQNYTYDKSAKQFEIKGTSLTGFTVSYKQGETPVINPTNAGTYDVIITRPEDDSYKSYSKTITGGLVINKAVVNVPMVASKVYTGENQTADIPESELYTETSNEGRTTVGTANVVLTLVDSANYKWSDGTETATKTIEFEITKANVNAITGLDIEGWTYGEDAKLPTASATFGTPNFTYVGTGETNYAESTTPPSNVGTYKVIAKVADTANFVGASDEKEFAIAKATPTYTAPVDLKATYGETLVDVTLPDGWSWKDSSLSVGNAGTNEFTAVFTPQDTTNFEVVEINVSVAVGKTIPSYDIPVDIEATYGDTLADVTLPDGWSWKDSTLSVGNAGTQTFVAVFTPSDTNNYNSVEENITITVAKKEVAEPAVSGSYTYTGSEQTVTLIGVESFMTVSGNKATNAGNYVVTVTLDDNHKWNASSDGEIEWSIAKADMSADITASGYNAVFDNQAHTISVNIPEGASIKYGITEGTYNLDVAPEYTNAGTYTVYYKVEKPNYNDVTGSADVVIDKKDIMNAEITLGEALTFDGNEQTQAIASATVDGLTITYDVSGNVNTNAGDYTLTITGNGNFEGTAQKTYTIARKSVEGANVGSFNALTYTGSAQTPVASVTIDGLTATGTWSNVTNVEDVTTFTASGNFTGTIANQSTGMAKATPVVTAPVAKEGLIYNTSALALADEGSTTCGTMQYSPDNATWSNDVPTETNAGDYTIYYRVVGNSNYNDVAAQSIFVSIANADMSADITADGYNRVFDNQAHTISVDIPEGASVKYGTADGTYELDDVPQYTNVGTYTVYYKVEKANYNAVTGRADVVITAKDISNAEITLGEALTYTESEQTRDFTVAPLDGLEIDYTVSGNVETYAGDYTLTIIGQGNFTGSKSASWSIGKASQSAPGTPAAVNETIKAKADGKITGVTANMEYKLEGASEYIAISETEIANLAAGTYLVRYKENANHLAGADKQLIIADGAMITVSFNSNEGTAVDSMTCEYNQAITAPAEPTKENFVFAGWYKDAECLELWNFGSTLTEDITLYAKWNDKPVYSVSGKVTDGESGLGGITVTLKQGNTIIATTTTAADGSYSFITEDGLYNIVAEKEENDNSTIKTVKIEVTESANVNDVVFVATDINSELEIKRYTPQIIVGGLDEEAQTVSSSNGNADVTVKMTVESTEDITGSDDATGQEQRQTEQKEIKKVSGNRYIQFIEINLTQSINGAKSTKLEETSGLIEIIIPFEKGNKRNITVYRYHGSASEKLGAGIGNANADGEYFEVKENHIVVYAKKFSTYAIGYDLPSSGGSSVTRYTVKFDTNGGSSVSSATVTKNAKVAEPKTPEKDGYTFGGWYTDKEFAEKYDFESKVTKNFTLYAKWDKHDDEQSGTDTHNCPSLAFDDLDITKWYHFDTDYVIENGIFKGTTETTFEPDSAQTRAMMVTVLYRVEGEPAVNRSIPFADVDMGAYYANAVIWGQQNGIIKGYSETEFGPDDKITREQIAAIMNRYAQYKGIDVSVGESTNILSYDDFDSISEYAIPSMQWAVGSGLIKGKSESTLNPLDNATRAEIAAILHRFIEANK